MHHQVTALLIFCLIFSAFIPGCADVHSTIKVDDFGTAFGNSTEEQNLMEQIRAADNNPAHAGNGTPRFMSPQISMALTRASLPADNVTSIPPDATGFYFFVIYDNFRPEDRITISWKNQESGKEIYRATRTASSGFGRLVLRFARPDAGWEAGRQQIAVAGDGAVTGVDFVIAANSTRPASVIASASVQREVNESAVHAVAPVVVRVSQPVTTPALRRIPTEVTCPAGQVACSGTCTDPVTDPENCGSCGNACETGGMQVCRDGVCINPVTTAVPTLSKVPVSSVVIEKVTPVISVTVSSAIMVKQIVVVTTTPTTPLPTPAPALTTAIPSLRTVSTISVRKVLCITGQTSCSGVCVNTSSDSGNCGSCGTACGARELCNNGVCTALRG